MSATPQFSAYIRNLQEQRERQMQTAFPARVVKWSSATSTVEVEPQFFEVWHVDGERVRETIETKSDAYIDNVPVCFPHFMSWDIPANAFGLVICTKYSLDIWRQRLQCVDPGDLRRFTMSGATFHPVVMGRSPSVAQQFVALANKVDAALSAIKTHGHEGTSATGAAVTVEASADLTSMNTSTGSSKVKAEV